jgi:lipid-A-disaccharide synthase
VGNPTVDSVCTRPNQQQTFADFCTQNQLPSNLIIAVLAGSRKQEISACLPRMIEAGQRFPDYQVVIAGAPGINPDFYKSILKLDQVHIVYGKTYELLQQSKAAIVNSGTATLETALVGTPQVVVYHVGFGRLAFLFKDFVIKVKFFSLVNLIAEKEVVKELVAHFFTVDNVANELNNLLNNHDYRENMLKEYSEIKSSLGEPGAAARAAKRIAP